MMRQALIIIIFFSGFYLSLPCSLRDSLPTLVTWDWVTGKLLQPHSAVHRGSLQTHKPALETESGPRLRVLGDSGAERFPTPSLLPTSLTGT